MSNIPEWKAIEGTPTYQSATPAEQDQMRNEWFDMAADADGVQGPQREEYRQKFMDSISRGNANAKIETEVKQAYQPTEFDEDYSGVGGAFIHGLTQENWAVQAGIKIDEWLEDKFGVEPGGITKKHQAMERAGYQYKPDGMTERIVHDATTMIPDVAVMSLTGGPLSKGLSSVVGKIAPSLVGASKAAKIAKGVIDVTAGAGSMGISGGIGGAIRDDTTAAEGFVGGAEMGGAAGATTQIVNAVAGLVEKRYPIIKPIKHIADIALGAAVMSGVQGDMSKENLEYNALFDLALKATHVPAKLSEMGASARQIAKQKQVLKKAVEIMPAYEKAIISTKIDGLSEADLNAKEHSEKAIEIFAESYARSTPLSKELIMSQISVEKYKAMPKEKQDQVVEKLYKKSAKETAKEIKSIGVWDQELNKPITFIDALSKIMKEQKSPEQLKRLDKTDIYHGMMEIFSKERNYKILDSETKTKILGELKPRDKREAKGIKALKDNITEVEYEITNYDRYMDHIKVDPEYTKRNFMDWGKMSREDIMKQISDRPEDFAKNLSEVHALRRFVADGVIHNLRDVVAKSCKAGKEFTDVVELAHKESAMLSGKWQKYIEPIKNLSPLHNDALRKYLQAKGFDEYVKEKKLSAEEVGHIKAIGDSLKTVHQEIALRAKEMQIKGFEEQADYFPMVVQEKIYKDPAELKRMISSLERDTGFFERIGGVKVFKEKGTGRILRVVEITDPVTKQKSSKAVEFTVKERREAARKFLMDYKNTRERRYGHLQIKKTFDNIPDEFLETNVYGVLSEYYDRSAKRMMEIKHFGERDQNLKQKLEEAATELSSDPTRSSDDVLHYMMNMKHAYDAVTYEHAHVSPLTEQFVNAWLGFNVLRKMFWSPVGQTGQFFSGIIRTGSPKQFGQVTWKRLTGGRDAFYNPETGAMEKLSFKDIALECGSANTMIMNDFMRTMVGDSKTMLQSAVSKMLDWNQFKRIDASNRVQAAGVGWMYAKDMMGRINKILSTDFAKKLDPTKPEDMKSLMKLLERKEIFGSGVKDKFAKRRLEQLGLSAETILGRGRGENGKFNLTKFELLTAARQCEIQTNFRASKLDLPLQFTHTGAGRMITQFNSYNYGRTKELNTFVVKEAKQGNLAPMAWLLTAGGLVGGGIEGVRLLLTNREMPEDMWDYYVESLGQFGAYGYLSNIYSMAEYGSTNLGASHDDWVKFSNAVNSLWKRDDQKFDYMARFIISDLTPFVNVIGKPYYVGKDRQRKKEREDAVFEREIRKMYR